MGYIKLHKNEVCKFARYIAVRDNLKEDARIRKFDLKKRMIYDIEEFSEEDSE